MSAIDRYNANLSAARTFRRLAHGYLQWAIEYPHEAARQHGEFRRLIGDAIYYVKRAKWERVYIERERARHAHAA